MLAGAVQVSLAWFGFKSAANACTPYGAAGTHAGRAWTAVLRGEIQMAFLPATRNEYWVPLVSPLYVKLYGGDTPSLTVVHVVPRSPSIRSCSR